MRKLILILMLGIGNMAFCQGNNQSLSDALQTLYTNSAFPGFAVAVVDKDGVKYENAFGYADLENKIPYTISSVQNIGSISKTFIGVALMKAIELGYFTLDSDINSILPYKVVNPYRKKNEIRIKDLATHTSGIIDNPNIYDKTFLLGKYSNSESPLYNYVKENKIVANRNDEDLSVFLENYLKSDGTLYSRKNFINCNSGSIYSYSNIASALAAHLIEIKSGMSFEKFSTIYILAPLRMTNSSWKITDEIVQKHVRNYNIDRKFYPLYSEITYPDGSLNTSISDLAKYLSEMIKGYNSNSELLSNESFKVLFEKQFQKKLPKNYDIKEPNSGIFWRYKANGQIGHTGSDLGITTFMFFDPATSIGKIFMTNIEFDSPKNDSIDGKLVQQFVEIWKALDKF